MTPIMSSKFNPSTKKPNYPSWCKPPPDPPVPPFIAGWPAQLIAYATWADHDPEKYAHTSESFPLAPIEPGKVYSGDSGSGIPRLELEIEHHEDSDTWTILFLIFDTWRNPEDFKWLKIPTQEDDPFKLFPPIDVVIPGEDWRSVHIYG